MRKNRWVMLACLMLIPGIVSAGEKVTGLSVLAPLRGIWSGSGEGFGGESTVKRTYRFVMDRTYMESRTVARFKPTKKKPEGDVHKDFGMFSYDKGRATIVFREFNSEGYVNRYVLTDVSADGRTWTFETEAVENGGGDLRARLILRMVDRNTLEETFELASGNQSFKACGHNRFKRQKPKKAGKRMRRNPVAQQPD